MTCASKSLVPWEPVEHIGMYRHTSANKPDTLPNRSKKFIPDHISSWNVVEAAAAADIPAAYDKMPILTCHL
jgi:hypothetical protein